MSKRNVKIDDIILLHKAQKWNVLLLYQGWLRCQTLAAFSSWRLPLCVQLCVSPTSDVNQKLSLTQKSNVIVCCARKVVHQMPFDVIWRFFFFFIKSVRMLSCLISRVRETWWAHIYKTRQLRLSSGKLPSLGFVSSLARLPWGAQNIWNSLQSTLK